MLYTSLQASEAGLFDAPWFVRGMLPPMGHPAVPSLLCLLIMVGAASDVASGQLVLTGEYERLRRYEGTYEDEGGGTLQIVASPRDEILVAVLGAPITGICGGYRTSRCPAAGITASWRQETGD